MVNIATQEQAALREHLYSRSWTRSDTNRAAQPQLTRDGRCLKIIENQSDCTIYDAANTKALISRELTVQLICIFYAKIRFSHHLAILYTPMRVVSQVIRNLYLSITSRVYNVD